MKHKPAIERLRQAGTTLVLDHPFFGILKTKMGYKEAPGGILPNGEKIMAMATDGKDIYFHPDWVDSVEDEEVLTTVAHEVLHPAMLHHVRGQFQRTEEEDKIWQQACDYAINPILKDAKFEMKPGEWLLDRAYSGKTAEQIYDILKRKPKQPKGGGKGQDQQKGGGGKGQQSKQDDKSQPSTGSGGGGSGQDDDDQAQQQPPQPEDRGKVIQAQDSQTQEAEWTVSLQQAAKTAAMHGNLPAGMQMIIDKVTKPRVDWRAILRRWSQQLSRSDYSFKQPNRRYIQQGLYLPQLKSKQMGALVVVYDSSGSTMSVAPIFMAELQSVVDEVQPSAVYLVMCDAVVQGVQKFERGDLIDVKVKGLGGTDFRDPFLWAEGKDTQEDYNGYYKRPSSILPLEEDIAGMVYLTDAEGTYPKEAPDFEVLWAITTDYQPGSLYYPPFGEVVKIEEYDT